MKWPAESTASGQGSHRERSPVSSWFSELLFLDDPGIATGQVQTCGLRRNSSSLDKAPKNAWLRPAEFFGKFFRDPPVNFFRNLGEVILSHSRIKCVLWLTVPYIFWCFSRNWCLISLIPQCCHDSKGNFQSVVVTACLRSLRTSDSPNKWHSRAVDKRLKTHRLSSNSKCIFC